jgi:mannose-6-phosphate isomerase-like protein (cupin superfamily)
VHRGQVVGDESMTLEFTATAAETGGTLHEMRARYEPETRFPPPHLHPAQDERFVVERGALVFVVDGQEQVVVAGGEIEIPCGAVHRVRNAGTVPAVALWQTRPALRTGEFFERYAAVQAGGGSPFALAAMVDDFNDVYRLALGPRIVTAGAVKLLAAVGRRRGRR